MTISCLVWMAWGEVRAQILWPHLKAHCNPDHGHVKPKAYKNLDGTMAAGKGERACPDWILLHLFTKEADPVIPGRHAPEGEGRRKQCLAELAAPADECTAEHAARVIGDRATRRNLLLPAAATSLLLPVWPSGWRDLGRCRQVMRFPPLPPGA